MDIAKQIEKLVLKHECVIIPGLGAFITNYFPAEIIPQQLSIQPPARKLVFNSLLNTNDGLLAHYLSQRMNVSYKTSLQLLELFVIYCQRDLAEGKQIAFGNLGILDRNNHNKLEFYPNTNVNYSEDAFGLKPLTLKQIQRKPDYNLLSPVWKAEIRPSNTKVLTLNRLALRKIAAVLIPLAILVSAVFFVPSLIENQNLQQTSVFSFLDSLKLNIFSQNDINDNTLEVENEELQTSADAILETEEVQEESTDIKASEFIVKEQFVEIPNGNYHIICGSFFEKNRADNLVNQLKAEGFPAYIAGQSFSGTYRVSIQSFANMDEASDQMDWLRYKGYERAWILVKSFK